MLDDSWEMGRLVISPEFRSGQEALRRCLLLSLSFLHDRAPVANLHATCTHALARLYRRIGFEVIATDVPLHGTSKSYTLIHGPFSRVMASLRAWDEKDQAQAVLADTRMYGRIAPAEPCMNPISLGSSLHSHAGAPRP
ncbi:MAG TPA: hypothetical protein VN649_06940 [Ramlibacter sp.]|nr:hypothetical protein [Ramlibacter sp.]